MRLFRLLLPATRVAASLALSAAMVGVLALGVAQHAGWVRVVTVQGGSMAPALGYGSLLVTTPAPTADVKVGDVVSMLTPDAGRTTHRVVAIDPATGALTTRGDANAADDPQSFTGPDVDVVRVHVPVAGRVLVSLTGPARPWALASVVLVAIASLAPDRARRPRGARRADPVRAMAAGS